MLPSVLPTETDHVPVLADEVLSALEPQPGQTLRRLHLRLGRPFRAARRPAARRRQADRDRPRPDGRAVLRAAPPDDVGEDAAAPRRVLRRGRRARVERRARGRRPARPRRLVDAARPAGARVLVCRRRAARHADGSVGRALRERRRERDGRVGAGRDLPPLRRGALRAPDRAGDRPAPLPAAVRPHRRPRRDDQAGDAGAGPVRRGSSGEAGVPGAPDRGQRRARLPRARAAGGARAAPSRTVGWRSSPSIRSRIGSSSASCGPRSTAAPARPTSRSAPAARRRRCGRSRDGRSVRRRPRWPAIRARSRRACAWR